MKSERPNPEQAQQLAQKLLSTRLIDIPGAENLKETDLVMFDMMGVKVGLEQLANFAAHGTEAIEDTTLPKLESVTVKDLLWAMLKKDFQLPLNDGQDVRFMASLPEDLVRKVLLQAFRTRAVDTDVPKSPDDSSVGFNSYVSFVEALETLADGKQPKKQGIAAMPKGLALLKRWMQSSTERNVDFRAKESADVMENRHYETRVLHIFGKLITFPVGLPDYIPQSLYDEAAELMELRRRTGATSQSSDEVKERQTALTNQIRELVKENEPMQGKDYKHQQEVVEILATPMDIILTHVVAQLQQINAAMGIKRGGGSRGRGGDTKED